MSFWKSMLLCSGETRFGIDLRFRILLRRTNVPGTQCDMLWCPWYSNRNIQRARNAEQMRAPARICSKHRWPFGKIDGPGKWNKPHLNQGPLSFKQTIQKGHLWFQVAMGCRPAATRAELKACCINRATMRSQPSASRMSLNHCG